MEKLPNRWIDYEIWLMILQGFLGLIFVFWLSCRTTTVSTTISPAPKLPSEITGKTVEEVLYIANLLLIEWCFLVKVIDSRRTLKEYNLQFPLWLFFLSYPFFFFFFLCSEFRFSSNLFWCSTVYNFYSRLSRSGTLSYKNVLGNFESRLMQ